MITDLHEAELDHTVAMRIARDAYDRELVKAAERAAVATRAADTRLATVRAAFAHEADTRDRLRDSYGRASRDDLLAALGLYRFRLAPVTRTAQDHAARADSRVHLNMICAELAGRGIALPADPFAGIAANLDGRRQ